MNRIAGGLAVKFVSAPQAPVSARVTRRPRSLATVTVVSVYFTGRKVREAHGAPPGGQRFRGTRRRLPTAQAPLASVGIRAYSTFFRASAKAPFQLTRLMGGWRWKRGTSAAPTAHPAHRGPVRPKKSARGLPAGAPEAGAQPEISHAQLLSLVVSRSVRAKING